MRTLRRARSPHFCSDLTLRSLFGDRAEDAEEGTFSSLTEEGAHRSLPEELFDETASDDSDSSPTDSSAVQMSSQGLSYSSLGKSVARHRSLSPWHGEARQNALAMKHKSLGATPLATAAPIPASPRKYHDATESAFAVKHRSLENLAREEFHKPVPPPRVGLRHRSLGGGRERSAIHGQHRSSLTPSFLEGLAERVRSASPTPKSLSSDPEKIIASLPNSPRQGSFSANGSRIPSNLGSEAQSVPSARTNSSVFGRGSRTGSLIPRSHDFDFDHPGAHSNTSLRPSTSLRRVLSLGRSRADSDLQSVVSEPGVYVNSAHIADDIWIAPKDLYSIERRLALKQFKKSKAAQDGRRREDQLALLAKNAVAEHVKKEGTSVTTTTESETPSEDDVEEEVVEDDETSSMKSTRKPFTGPADVNHAETSLSNSDYPKPDPFEYGGKSDLHDMSSRLIRLFFSSGSQNPVPPSAVRAAEMRNQESSRSFFWRRNPDRARTNVQQQRGMSGNMPGNPSMQHNRSVNSNFGGYEVPPSEQVYEFDLRAKFREISKFANVRAWIRRRAYRRSQRKPERRPREAQT